MGMQVAVLTTAPRWFCNTVRLRENRVFDILEKRHAFLLSSHGGCGVNRDGVCIRGASQDAG